MFREPAIVWVEAVCLFQRTVDRREFGIDFGFYSRDSDENAERYA
jgi:hypothetical protein